MRRFLLLGACAVISFCACTKSFTLQSPNGENVVKVQVDASDDPMLSSTQILWSVEHDGHCALAPSAISMLLSNDRELGTDAKVRNVRKASVRALQHSSFYRKKDIPEEYNSMTISFKGGWALEFRAYDAGVAYRFLTSFKEGFKVLEEQAEFIFPEDCRAFIPYETDPRDGDIWCVSFESFYVESALSEMTADTLSLSPLLVDEGFCKVAVMDAGQEDYPGMFLVKAADKFNGRSAGDCPGRVQGGKVVLDGAFAPVPTQWRHAGANLLPTSRENFIADCPEGTRSFPWRVAVIADKDIELADCDLAWLLAPECRLEDTSWIKPGQSAWEWWNAMNVTGVDFAVGSNTETYKYYADFAAENGLPYMIVDGGWSVGGIMQAHEGLDIEELVKYAGAEGVGVILWSGYADFRKDYLEAVPYYAEMGVKGFKVDFFDRDDQVAVNDMRAFAQYAAKHHVFLDLHGMKAFGINRTYPNVLSYEGVRGLENFKWADIGEDGMIAWDFPRYDVTIPFIRALTGAYDYTPGAMDNAQKHAFRTMDENPMSEGTRVHQLAMYTVYEAPLQMLSDTPVKYRANQECVDFIKSVPTVYDKTVMLDGKVGEYIVTAREKDGVWYIGAMTNRSARTLDIDLSILESLPGDRRDFKAEIFADGPDAAVDGTDYTHSVISVSSADTLTITLAPAGGWAAIIR